MNRSKVLFSGLIASLITATLGLAVPATAPEQLTVGDFAALFASRMSSDGMVRPVTPAGADDILKKSGIRIRTSLSSPLTEADASDLFKQYGITLQVQNPGALLSRDRTEALVSVFGSTLTAATNMKATGISRDSKVGTQRVGALAAVTVETATTLLDCRSLPRAPTNQCQDCCIHTLGLADKTCGHACQKRNLVTTPTDPTPQFPSFQS